MCNLMRRCRNFRLLYRPPTSDVSQCDFSYWFYSVKFTVTNIFHLQLVFDRMLITCYSFGMKTIEQLDVISWNRLYCCNTHNFGCPYFQR